MPRERDLVSERISGRDVEVLDFDSVHLVEHGHQRAQRVPVRDDVAGHAFA
jgi:hypothetical protein